MSESLFDKMLRERKEQRRKMLEERFHHIVKEEDNRDVQLQSMEHDSIPVDSPTE